MAYKQKMLISDNPSEDKGYSQRHRQTIGGIQAYQRGEMPLSYWNKKRIMERVVAQFHKLKRDMKYYNRYKSFITYLNMPEKEILEHIEKVNLTTLRKILLEYRGAHYTGNFFRYTKFYGLVSPTTMLIRVKNSLIKPKEVIQMKLNFIGVETNAL